MKALSALCSSGGAAAAAVPAIANGRVQTAARHRNPNGNRSDSENAEIQMYLSKLKDLVPFMPKNRKLSKLEVIQHVIDYICDLQTALETHPITATGQSVTATTTTSPFEDYLNNNDIGSANHNSNSKASLNGHHHHHRQPLGVRPSSPNQIVGNGHHQQQQHHSNSNSPTSLSNTQSAADLLFLQHIMSTNNNNNPEKTSSASSPTSEKRPAC